MLLCTPPARLLLTPPSSTSLSDITTSSDGSLGAYEYRLSQATPPPRKPEDKKGKGREFPLTTRGAVDLTYRGRASTSEKDTDGNNEKLGLRSRIRASLRGTAKTAVDGSGQGENAQRPHDRLGLETPVDATATSTPTNMKPPSRTEEGNTTNPELPPPYTDAINEYLLDPIQQFSALPPVTLRSSQQAFRLALQEGLKVIMAQQHYARLCDVIEAGNHDGCKKSI